MIDCQNSPSNSAEVDGDAGACEDPAAASACGAAAADGIAPDRNDSTASACRLLAPLRTTPSHAATRLRSFTTIQFPPLLHHLFVPIGGERLDPDSKVKNLLRSRVACDCVGAFPVERGTCDDIDHSVTANDGAKANRRHGAARGVRGCICHGCRKARQIVTDEVTQVYVLRLRDCRRAPTLSDGRMQGPGDLRGGRRHGSGRCGCSGRRRDKLHSGGPFRRPEGRQQGTRHRRSRNLDRDRRRALLLLPRRRGGYGRKSQDCRRHYRLQELHVRLSAPCWFVGDGEAADAEKTGDPENRDRSTARAAPPPNPTGPLDAGRLPARPPEGWRPETRTPAEECRLVMVH